MEIKTLNLKLKTIEKDTPDTVLLTFELNEKLEFSPGQFMMIEGVVGEGEERKSIKRAYSIASSPTDKGVLQFLIKQEGEKGLSHKLVNSKEGDEYGFTGPFGKFAFEDISVKNVILLAAGSGLAPMRSIARYITSTNLPAEVQLFYSVRKPINIARKQELEELKEKYPNFEFIVTVTRPDDTVWHGEIGRINSSLIKKYAKSIDDSLFFICGTPGMVRDMVNLLQNELGVPSENINMEQW